MMAFSGKRFRRVRAENMEELLKVTNANDSIIRALQQASPVFSFTQLDSDTFSFCLDTGDHRVNNTFKLGQETEMERRDGSKVKVTYILEGDNVLKQVIKTPDGRISKFRREFGERETKMTITTEGSDVEARIYYEIVE
ncbi:hypothetical protein ACJJTC_017398 [Scirpophaga incertulas]